MISTASISALEPAEKARPEGISLWSLASGW
jgi:hypothetical protein